MVHGINFSKLNILPTVVLRIQIPVILTFFNTRDLYSRCAAHTQSNW